MYTGNSASANSPYTLIGQQLGDKAELCSVWESENQTSIRGSVPVERCHLFTENKTCKTVK